MSQYPHSIQTSDLIQKTIKIVLDQNKGLREIISSLSAHGARILLVGGAVRDMFLGLSIKDVDIEIHGMSLDQLKTVLAQFGFVDEVGKAFGVLRLTKYDIDWSVPRIDSAGRKPIVQTKIDLPIEQAFARRDLTINAMGIDMVTSELIDPFHGLHDLITKTLRAPNASFFLQDPLRFYRVMQFIGRFEMYPDQELTEVCRTMDISQIARERIEVEFEKLFLRSKRASLGVRWLEDIDRLKEILPELAATKGVVQDRQWHPEGDVFEHSMQTLDAVYYAHYQGLEKVILSWAAVCHDLGKVGTTETEDGKIISHNHQVEGVPLARSMLKRVTANGMLIAAVERLVRYHLDPIVFVEQKSGKSAYKRLALKLAPYTNMAMLAQLAQADKRGRNPKGHEPLRIEIAQIDLFLSIVSELHIEYKPEEPLVLGRDVMNIIAPGPSMGELLDHLYALQIEDHTLTKQDLLERAHQWVMQRQS